MTKEEFLSEVSARSKPGDFYLDASGQIWSRNLHQCPICWLGTQMGLNPDNKDVLIVDVSNALKLSDGDRWLIALSADKPSFEPELRASLIRACKL